MNTVGPVVLGGHFGRKCVNCSMSDMLFGNGFDGFHIRAHSHHGIYNTPLCAMSNCTGLQCYECGEVTWFDEILPFRDVDGDVYCDRCAGI